MKEKINLKLLFQDKKNAAMFIGGICILVTVLSFILTDIITYDHSETLKKSEPTFKLIFKSISTVIYFTYLSNLFLGSAMLGSAIAQNRKSREAYFISVLLITITFLIYWSLIAFQTNWKQVYNATTSLITHCIVPIFGFVMLFLIRKDITVTKNSLFISSGIVFTYFFFALIIYFATYGNFKGIERGYVIYSFLDFKFPFYYKGGNLIVVILLDLLAFLIGATVPVGLFYFWLFVTKIKYQKSKCILKRFSRKKIK